MNWLIHRRDPRCLKSQSLWHAEDRDIVCSLVRLWIKLRCRSPIVPVGIALVLVASLSGCGSRVPVKTPSSNGPIPEPSVAAKKPILLSSVFDLRTTVNQAPVVATTQSPFFTEIARAAGVQHTYLTGSPDFMLMVQPVGGGCGWLDFDGDGHWDLYLNQAGNPTKPRSTDQPADQLYRNLGDHQFRPVTSSALIDERDYSQGVAIGDFDNDGFDDVFVTNASATDTLLQNQGDGTFLDVSHRLPSQDKLWSSSAAWGDIDRDGDLDLYVGRYVAFDRFHPVECRSAKGERKMCQPNDVEGAPDECFLNAGDGTFRAAARELGLFGPANKALGIAIADFDNDDWPDIYVANDATPAFLYVNQKNGHFKNMADVLGCALSLEGRAQAGMGVAVGDYDRNGFLDLYLTHFEGEWNTLYQNLGSLGFSDVTGIAGGVEPTLPMVGWGSVMEDFNQDGIEDLIVANGHLDDPGHLGVELALKPQLFTFAGPRMVECSDRGGDFFRQKSIGRGLASADYDDDGDLDVAIVNQNVPLSLLRNESQRGNWLKLQFAGRDSNRRGIGTRVTLTVGDDKLMKELAGGTSYCASNQPVLVFGLGNRSGLCHLVIRWPNGRHQRINDVGINQQLQIVEPLEAEVD